MSRLCSANKKGEPRGGSPRPVSPGAMGLGGVHCLEFLKNNHILFEFPAILESIVVAVVKALYIGKLGLPADALQSSRLDLSKIK